MANLPALRRACGLLIVPTFFLVTQLSASADQLENNLNQQYKDRIYTLRQPMTAPTQQYDAQGNSPTASAIGPWTVYGRVQIKNIKVKTNRLVIEGQRIGVEFDNHSKTLIPAKLAEKVTLQISLSRPLDSVDEVHEIFSHIFAFTKNDFLASVPEFWRKYLVDYIDGYAENGSGLTFKPQLPVPPLNDQASPSSDVFHTGNGVTAPKAIHPHDPDYTDAARKELFSGIAVFNVIIDKQGNVARIELKQPAGLGLDENSVATMKGWKFQPAMRNGEAVAVEVRIEMTFNLYL